MTKAFKAMFVAVAVLLCGCNKSSDTPTSSETEELVSTEQEDTTQETEVENEATPEYHFYELENDEAQIIDFYRFEVSKRIKSGGDFATDDEKHWYEANGYIITNAEDGVITSLRKESQYYIFPIVVYIEGKEVLVYTSEKGYVYADYSGIDNLNLTYEEKESLGKNVEVLQTTETVSIIYNPDESLFQVFKLGKLTESLSVKGIYAGVSFWVGYIFRDGSDVYAVSWNQDLGRYDSVVIAHHVKYVIDADYKLGSDPWSQPLFLMEDGSIKAYLDWNNKEVPDSPENLVEPYYEGGYH